MYLQKGEVREVGIEVISTSGDDFIIEAAEYIITTAKEVEIDKGIATIDGHKVITLFTASEKGHFEIIFKYHIGPETLKSKICVEVDRY